MSLSVSNYNNLLREKMSTDKASCIRQNSVISDENIFAPKLCATENDHRPNGLNDKNIDKDSKFTNNDNCIQPKNCMPIECFYNK